MCSSDEIGLPRVRTLLLIPIVRAKTVNEFALGPHLLANLIKVVEVVGESRVHVCQGDARKMRYDLIWSHPLVFVPHHDIEHTDSVTCDAGLAAADTFRFGDPGFGGTRHNSSIRQFRGTGVPQIVVSANTLSLESGDSTPEANVGLVTPPRYN